MVLLLWRTMILEWLKKLKLMTKCLQPPSQRGTGRRIFITRKMSLYARDGWMLAKILLTVPINPNQPFGEEFMPTLKRIMRWALWGQRARLCIGGWQFSSKLIRRRNLQPLTEPPCFFLALTNLFTIAAAATISNSSSSSDDSSSNCLWRRVLLLAMIPMNSST